MQKIFNKKYRLVAQIFLSCLFLLPQTAFSTVDDVLQKIHARTCESNSDIVFVLQHGKPIAAFGSSNQYQPIDTRSITKSFVSLAIGLLIDEGAIACLDTPVYCFFPEWNQGTQQSVTIRHLLNHTSGIENGYEMNNIQSFPNILQMALSTDFSFMPGTGFCYNNKAVNLLAGIVAKASGESLPNYLHRKLFCTMGITSDTWLYDQCGNVFGMSCLMMNALDLAKVGMLIAQNGCWNGERLISESWIRTLFAPSQEFNPFCSALWWLEYKKLVVYWDQDLINQYDFMGIPEQYIAALKKLGNCPIYLEGQISYKNYADWFACRLEWAFGSAESVYDCFRLVESYGLPLARWKTGEVRQAAARGFMGQQLIIMPQSGLVAVRLSSEPPMEYNGVPDKFSDLECLMIELAEELKCNPCTVPLVSCCDTATPEPFPAPYDCCTDPEFYKPSLELCYQGPIEQPCSPCVIPSFDTRDIPYYTPKTEKITPYYQPKAPTAKPKQKQQSNFDFGSAYEGTNSPHTKITPDQLYQIYSEHLYRK